MRVLFVCFFFSIVIKHSLNLMRFFLASKEKKTKLIMNLLEEIFKCKRPIPSNYHLTLLYHHPSCCHIIRLKKKKNFFFLKKKINVKIGTNILLAENNKKNMCSNSNNLFYIHKNVPISSSNIHNITNIKIFIFGSKIMSLFFKHLIFSVKHSK